MRGNEVKGEEEVWDGLEREDIKGGEGEERK